mgnify:CR=1 FL=1
MTPQYWSPSHTHRGVRKLTLLVIFLMCSLAGCGGEDFPTGTGRVTKVIDGDTIEVRDRRFRLHGIDAPESKQACPDGWAAGVEATQALRTLIGSQEVQI